MASTIEKSYGSRLANAQKLATHLSTFTDYAPSTPAGAIDAYDTLITDITALNSDLATASSTFTTSTDARQQLFFKAPDSMIKTLTPIAAYVRAAFGKDSTQAQQVASLILKLRGQKTDKFKKDETGEWVSQSQRSFGSMTDNFSSLIDTLTSFGAAYAPTNASIKLTKLNTLLTQLTTANNAVTATYGTLKGHQDDRAEIYDTLSTVSSSIKETIKSIYGNSSTEFKLVKGLKI